MVRTSGTLLLALNSIRANYEIKVLLTLFQIFHKDHCNLKAHLFIFWKKSDHFKFSCPISSVIILASEPELLSIEFWMYSKDMSCLLWQQTTGKLQTCLILRNLQKPLIWPVRHVQETGLKLMQVMKFVAKLEYFTINFVDLLLELDLQATMIKTLWSPLIYLTFWKDLTGKFVVSRWVCTMFYIIIAVHYSNICMYLCYAIS